MEEINYFNELEKMHNKLNRDMADKWKMISDMTEKLDDINKKLYDFDERIGAIEDLVFKDGAK